MKKSYRAAFATWLVSLVVVNLLGFATPAAERPAALLYALGAVNGIGFIGFFALLWFFAYKALE
jgi:hypothetical protein